MIDHDRWPPSETDLRRILRRAEDRFAAAARMFRRAGATAGVVALAVWLHALGLFGGEMRFQGLGLAFGVGAGLGLGLAAILGWLASLHYQLFRLHRFMADMARLGIAEDLAARPTADDAQDLRDRHAAIEAAIAESDERRARPEHDLLAHPALVPLFSLGMLALQLACWSYILVFHMPMLDPALIEGALRGEVSGEAFVPSLLRALAQQDFMRLVAALAIWLGAEAALGDALLHHLAERRAGGLLAVFAAAPDPDERLFGPVKVGWALIAGAGLVSCGLIALSIWFVESVS